MLKEYDSEIKTLLSAKDNSSNWDEIYKKHKFMLKTIRHERLIHLLVTLFVGIVMSMSFFATIISGLLYLALLDVPLLMLFVGYLLHYRFLENTTQSWTKIALVIIKNQQ